MEPKAQSYQQLEPTRHLTRDMEPFATTWAGRSLEQHPKMSLYVFPKGRSELLSRGASQQLTSSLGRPLIPRAQEVERRPWTSVGLPNHMVSHPETGQWLL